MACAFRFDSAEGDSLRQTKDFFVVRNLDASWRLWRKCCCSGCVSSTKPNGISHDVPYRAVRAFLYQYVISRRMFKPRPSPALKAGNPASAVNIPAKDSGIGVESSANTLGDGPRPRRAPRSDELLDQVLVAEEEVDGREEALEMFPR